MLSMKKKLFIAVISSTIGILLLVTASVAWFTLSTSPEIGGLQINLNAKSALLLSKDGREYSQFLNLGEFFEDLLPLRPVSTVDGKNWFIAQYNNETGELLDTNDFILDNTLEFANVSKLSIESTVNDPVVLDGLDLDSERNLGYYAYTDFWLKTIEDSVNVRLTVPSNTQITFEEDKEGKYGTYVLQTAEVDSNSVLHLNNKKAESAVRVGFLINPTKKVETDSNGINKKDSNGKNKIVDDNDFRDEYSSIADTFYIYEPNADKRSGSSKPYYDVEKNDGLDYVLGYNFNSTEYVNGNYFITKPIGLVTREGGISYEPVNIDDSLLLVQKTSSWNENKLLEKLKSGKHPNSDDVGYFGAFVNTSSVYESLENESSSYSCLDITEAQESIAGSNILVTLKKETPVKVRLFVWIEGQDVDCWNDISAGGFLVNLELAAEVIE